MKLEYRFASDDDLDLLAEWNYQLIRDEGHRNPMTIPQLRERIKEWLAREYKAVVFHSQAEMIAYALYREQEGEIYLRQLFVRQDCRRQGVGQEAVAILREKIWPRHKRLTVEVLTKNAPAVAFWRSVGYIDYCLTLEIVPEDVGDQSAATNTPPYPAER
jgi:GNAT superfamily N-acetyltransferase